MPRLYAVVKIERKTYRHVELHKIHVPDFQDPGFYRSVSTLSAFAHHGDKDKNRGNWSPTHLYVVKRWEEFMEDTTRWKESYETITKQSYPDNLDDRLLPTFEHASIWDFYKHQGYDYKKKRWNRL